MAQQPKSSTGTHGRRWPWDEMEMMLEHIFSPPRARTAPVLRPAVDVFETPKEFIIICDVPGMDPENVEVTLQGRVLTIRGERAGMQEPGEWLCHLMERPRGLFERRVHLPTLADPNGIEAACKNGVLRVKVVKPEARNITLD